MQQQLIKFKNFLTFGSLFSVLAVGSSQCSAQQNNKPCFEVSDLNVISLTGTLSIQLFPGIPNFQSIAAGDEEERTFILELNEKICIRDKEGFADPNHKFFTVHLKAQGQLRKILDASETQSLEVKGIGYPSHTGHHHAPLVLDVNDITVLKARN